MSDKNIQMKSKNGTGWDNLYPNTKGANVVTNDGNTLEQHVTDTTKHITAAERTAWNAKQTALGYTPVNKAGDTMTGTLTLASDPVNVLDAVTKQYVDTLFSGLDPKASVKAATTANIAVTTATATTLTLTSALTALDGYTLVVGDRILVKDQTAAVQNGIYVYSNSTTLTRSSDADSSTDLTTGAFTFIENGATWGGCGWFVSTTGTLTLGTSAINWTQFSSPGVIVVDGTLTKTGNVISLKSGVATAGTYTKLTIDTYGRVTGGTTLSAADIPNLDWSKITSGKPTNLSGYGITDAAPSTHVGSGGTAHAVATEATAGFMSSADKTKLDGLSTGSNSIVVSATDPTTANADFWYAVL